MEEINELFDSPLKKTINHTDTEILKKALPDHRHVQVHDLEDGSKMVSYHKNGYLEVHHYKNGESGVLIKSDKPNPRFVGTMLDHYKKEGLDKGHPVKIISTPELHKHYSRIVDKLNKDGRYNIEHEDIEQDGRPYKSIKISHKSVIENIIKILEKS